jgi:hypothetical protein
VGKILYDWKGSSQERFLAAGLNPPLFHVLNLVDAAEGRSQQAIEVPASRLVAPPGSQRRLAGCRELLNG